MSIATEKRISDLERKLAEALERIAALEEKKGKPRG